jgi:exodeoxyribonuclease-3
MAFSSTQMLQHRTMKIVTWNVNSIKARHDRFLAFLERHAPDVVCLQELKTEGAKFPLDPIRAAGYFAVVHGQKTYNGVAIISRSEPTDVRIGLDDGVEDPQARLVAATVAGVRILSAYFPNGQEIGSDKYAYKLSWMGRLRAYLGRHHHPSELLALCGDFNVAPDELDIAQPERWQDTVLTSDAVREALRQVARFGLVDVVRKHHPKGGIYSWWDYRQLAFAKGNGMRIDHIFVTSALAARSVGAEVDRDERKGQSPSDHAPVIARFE